jgi:hypothetical protein
MNNQCTVSHPSSFDKEAIRWLQSNCVSVVKNLAVHGLPAKTEWHPNGFIVSTLNVACPFPLARLHIWPSGVRQLQVDHPRIHSHDRDMASMVVGGRYTDVLYVSNPAKTQSQTTHQTFRITPSDASASHYSRETVVPSGQYISLRSTQWRAIHVGRVHAISSGVIHKTTITDDRVCATLVVKSDSRGQELEYLVGGANSCRIIVVRRPLTSKELRHHWSLLLPLLESFLTFWEYRVEGNGDNG